jgi:two-component system CheB/CheR fusion protein
MSQPSRSKRPIITDSSAPAFPVVGIGASAGGLKAIRLFFDSVPPTTGMAFVVIVHLDPDHKSQMAELIQSHTAMRVTQPQKSVRLEPGNVYVIPPDRNLSLSDGHIRLTPRKKSIGLPAPIDLFFETLARTHGRHAIAIVLSGTGRDGTQGIKTVRESGGVTMAQLPQEAEHPEMPQSAISTRQVDFVLPVSELAAEAVRISPADRVPFPASVEEMHEPDRVKLSSILGHLRLKTGHDFSGYKRATLLRRVERRMQFTQSENLSEYLERLRSLPDETEALFNDLCITVTSFFRDTAAFAALERAVIPRLVERADPLEGVRVWVTGCATGEEAYSVGILLCEQLEAMDRATEVQIFATDIHEKSFAFAREGLYPETIASEVSETRLSRFFSREPGGYRVKKQIRELVLFANHDMLTDPPFTRIDLVTCRNLLIYLGTDAKRRAMSVFHFALRPGGYLFLGTSESPEDTPKIFSAVEKKERIYQALDTPRRLHGGGAIFRGLRRVTSENEPRGDVPVHGSRLPSALHQQLIEAHSSPSLVVNSDGEIIHLSNRAGDYLTYEGGEPTHTLVDLVPRKVRSRLRALLASALTRGNAAEANGLLFPLNGNDRVVNVHVRPMTMGPSGRFALVVFDEPGAKGSKEQTVAAKGPRRRPGNSESSDSYRELAEMRKQLRVTVEEYDAALEEAKAANEELQSINEEQKATAEELETSREELQSLNEELRTVNQEFRNQNEQLAMVNADLENLIDSTEIGTIFLDRELNVRRFTPVVAQVFNFVAADVGRPISHVTNRLRYPELTDDLRRVMQTLGRLEREVIAEDGRWFMTRISPYRSLEDRIEGVVITLFDTTDRKRIEVERELLLHDAQTASIAKSDFVGVMSHEFRTPLNAIIGYAGIIGAGAVGDVSEDQRVYLARIASSATHLSHMIDDTLESVRMETGAEKVDVMPVQLTALVREVCSGVDTLARKRSLDLRLDVPENVTIVSDATKVRQVLYNLLANAVRYTDKGGIDVTVRVEGPMVVVTVADTGIGIAAEHYEKIFERFWQVDQSTTRIRGGTGLGLMVSRGLARLLGGDVTVSSEIGRGSVFRFTLPSSETE